MSNYNTSLNTWGATGTTYPNGYSYIEGEQPVDDWDNFFMNNTVKDIQHLITLTNNRIESGGGTTFPTSPEPSHAFYRSDKERLFTYNNTSSSWNGLLKVDGDTLQGDLDLNGNKLKGIGSLSLTGDTDLSGNDLKDTTSGNLLYDSSAGHIPLHALESSNVGLTTSNHLSVTGSISLGGSVNVEVNDDFLLNDGDRLTGELVGERSGSSRVFTARNSSSGDKLSLRMSGSNTFQLVGYDSSAGAWDYNSALSYDPSTAKWKFGSLPSVSGNNIATQTWVNSSADVSQADNANTVGGESPSAFADSNHGNEEHSSNFTTLTEVNNNADVPNADNADETRSFESRTNYPTNPSAGQVVFRTDKT